MYIDKAAAYIEVHLGEELDVAALAGALFVSVAQLYRDFYSETGHSVKEYIRKRRLSRALALVKSSDMSLSMIAAESGYSSQQAFNKSVRSMLGMTPLDYKSSSNVWFFPRYEREGVYSVKVSSESLPQLVRLDFCHPHLRGIEKRALTRLSDALPAYKGRIFGRNGTQKGAQHCYELLIEQPSCDTASLAAQGFAGFEPASLADGLYAVTVVRNSDAVIGQAWDYLYNGWLKTSMFEQSDTPYFEEYMRRDGLTKRLGLFLPVRERKGFDVLSLQAYEDMLFLASGATGENAEEKAAATVIDYLSSRCPHLLRETRQFYVAQSGAHTYGVEYTCGVRIMDPLPVPAGSGLINLRIEGGDFAVLEGACAGDSTAFESVLRAWLRETGLSEIGTPFTVFETDGGFRTQNIRTKVFMRIKK